MKCDHDGCEKEAVWKVSWLGNQGCLCQGHSNAIDKLHDTMRAYVNATLIMEAIKGNDG